VITANLDEKSSAKIELWLEFSDFLYEEARFMDDSLYDDWFELWAPDCLYWVPCNSDDVDPAVGISIIYENHEKIEERILRLKSKFALAQSPQSRLIRSVSNIRITEASTAGISGSSRFVIGEVRYDRQTAWFGRAEYELVRLEGALKIAKKKVFLLNNNIPTGNMSFLI